MWDLIVSVPDHCLSFYFDEVKLGEQYYAIQRISISINVNLF